jgi:hypothetical protein
MTDSKATLQARHKVVNSTSDCHIRHVHYYSLYVSRDPYDSNIDDTITFLYAVLCVDRWQCSVTAGDAAWTVETLRRTQLT